jgi:hypothetical protein
MEYLTRDATEFKKLSVLFPLMKNNENAVIAGGVFKDLFLERSFRDIDLFFCNQKDFLNKIEDLKVKSDLKIIYENNNAVGYFDLISKWKIDFVQKQFGSPKEILDSFDFSVSKFCLFKDQYGMKVMFHYCFFEDLTNKNLKFDPEVVNPISLLSRAIKYSSYGFNLSKSDFLYLTSLINTLEPELFRNLSMQNFYSYQY